VNTEAELQFDGWTVNRVSGELARGGKTSRLPPQPLRILIELYDRAGEVVTREQLVKAVWPTGIIDFDNGLNVAVRKLRVALDDVGDEPKYIETLPRAGYRFIGRRGVQSAPAIGAALDLTRRARMALIVTLAAFALAIAGVWWWTPVSNAHVPSERAQELYLDGIHQRSRRDISILNARELAYARFAAALEEDPDYAQAWAALAASMSVAVHLQVVLPAEGVPKARAAAQRAIALDERLPDGHVSLGEIYLKHDRNFAAAKEEFDRALELDDRSSRAWHHIAIWHSDMGQVDEALAALRRARELDPMTLQWSANYGRMLYNARRYDEVIALLQPLVAANPNLDPAHSVLAWAFIATGDLAGAEEQLRLVRVPALNQSDWGFLRARQGRREDALREIERLEALGRKGHGVAYEQAVIFAALGELDRGCEALSRAVDDGSVILGWMRLDPRLDPLRGRQCFTEVEKRVYRSTVNPSLRSRSR
jgi:DNA-binding winged helix-turn-helix (wHTH) protein/Flp pilus assembly protein TadD